MKESIGGTASLNIALAFISIVFAFLAATLSYYKAFKVNNIINNAIEKYEGYNDLAVKEINERLNSIGYQRFDTECKSTIRLNEKDDNSVYNPVTNINSIDVDGICVYMRNNVKKKSYQYLVVSYMTINVPIVSEFIKIPVKTVTNEIYGCYGNNEEFISYNGKISCE